MPVDAHTLRDRTRAAGAERHPLDPLSVEEIAAAVRIVRTERRAGPSIRFETVELKEPPKAVLRARRAGIPVKREAVLAVFDIESDALFEAVVDLDESRVTSWRAISGARPTIMPEELAAVERCVKADPRFAEALRRRGIEDVALAQVDAWSAGSYGLAEEEDVRVSHAFVWLKNHEHDNGYAHPVEGLNVVVDINRLKVLRIDDHGGPPVPMAEHNYAARFQKRWRTDLKPLEIVQPDGPSFTVEGNLVRWQKWRIRVGFTGREGLVLHDVAYDDDGRLRPILHRASLAEMIVPYGDPTAAHYRKNAFDVGEYGIGRMTNSLKLGCDCLGVVRYFDVVVNDMAGRPIVIENAICLHEEDAGLLWKHWDWRTNEAEVRRSRRLVISSIATVGNYEYGFYWCFYQDGTIVFEVKLTGIINTAGGEPGALTRFGTEVAPGVIGQIHQHIFNVRLDVSVDGEANSVVEVDFHTMEPGPDNPHDNAFFGEETLLATEKAARRRADPTRARYWKIVNPHARNALGQSTAYRLLPHGAVPSFTSERARVSRRAGFIRNHLWVTPYAEDERFPAGRYVNQSSGEGGIDSWTEQDRAVEATDIVVWHTFGHHHLPRPEDFPVQPVVSTGFTLQPFGFFRSQPRARRAAGDIQPKLPGAPQSLSGEPNCVSRAEQDRTALWAVGLDNATPCNARRGCASCIDCSRVSWMRKETPLLQHAKSACRPGSRPQQSVDLRSRGSPTLRASGTALFGASTGRQPLCQGRFANGLAGQLIAAIPCPAADLRRRRPALLLTQHADDLLLIETALPHSPSPNDGLSSTEGSPGEQVTSCRRCPACGSLELDLVTSPRPKEPAGAASDDSVRPIA